MIFGSRSLAEDIGSVWGGATPADAAPQPLRGFGHSPVLRTPCPIIAPQASTAPWCIFTIGMLLVCLCIVLCYAWWRHWSSEQKLRAFQEENQKLRARQEEGTTKTPHEENCSNVKSGTNSTNSTAKQAPEALVETEEAVPPDPSTSPSMECAPHRVTSRISPQSSTGSLHPRRDPSTGSLHPKRDPGLNRKTHPTLTAEQQARLKKILDGGRIDLDYETRQLKLTHGIRFRQEAIDFSPRADICPPTFIDENVTTLTLMDVAELLNFVYNTAIVHVEAHAATRNGMIDPVALKMTQQQSELVKNELINGGGVEPTRIFAHGLPGSRGSGKSEIVLRITSY